MCVKLETKNNSSEANDTKVIINTNDLRINNSDKKLLKGLFVYFMFILKK